jgi:restriction endonuclease S subunit
VSKYKKDEKYKNSGEEWIDKVPVNFKIEKLKYLSKFIGKGKIPINGAKVCLDDGIIFIRNQNINQHVYIIRPILESITPYLLFMIMSSEFIKNQIITVQNASLT